MNHSLVMVGKLAKYHLDVGSPSEQILSAIFLDYALKCSHNSMPEYYEIRLMVPPYPTQPIFQLRDPSVRSVLLKLLWRLWPISAAKTS